MEEEQDKQEQKIKEESNTQSHILIKVSRDEDFLEHIGRKIYFDLVDHENVRQFRIQKQVPFRLFKARIAKEFGVQMQFQRFWTWGRRKNGTHRPCRPITPLEEKQPVGQLREVSWSEDSMIELFLEVELGVNLQPISLPEKTEEELLLFLKLYDPLKEELRYVGRLFVKKRGKPVEILSKLNKLAGFCEDEEIKLFEEIKFEPFVMCTVIDTETTFRENVLQDGDIICFQKSQVGIGQTCRHPDVATFLKYVHDCKHQEPTAIEVGERSSPFAEFDKLFTDIQKLVEGNTFKAKNFSCFLPPPYSVEEIANAKKFVKQCLNMNLASFIQTEKSLELQNSHTVMLTGNAFPDDLVDRTTKFLADFDQSCEQYESAKQDIRKAQEDEKAVGELTTSLKKLFSEFIPVRSQAEAVDRELAWLENQVTERKAKKERLGKRLEDLAGRATTSKQALVSAEEEMKLSTIKKEQAEKTVGDMEKAWESFKVDCSLLLQ